MARGSDCVRWHSGTHTHKYLSGLPEGSVCVCVGGGGYAIISLYVSLFMMMVKLNIYFFKTWEKTLSGSGCL